jgi:hypothetical protein
MIEFKDVAVNKNDVSLIINDKGIEVKTLNRFVIPIDSSVILVSNKMAINTTVSAINACASTSSDLLSLGVAAYATKRGNSLCFILHNIGGNIVEVLASTPVITIYNSLIDSIINSYQPGIANDKINKASSDGTNIIEDSDDYKDYLEKLPKEDLFKIRDDMDIPKNVTNKNTIIKKLLELKKTV